MTATMEDLGSDTIAAGSCPGCGELVQMVHGNHTATGEHENWRFGLVGEDAERDCAECRKRPAA